VDDDLARDARTHAFISNRLINEAAERAAVRRTMGRKWERKITSQKERTYRFARFVARSVFPFPFSFSLCFSFASKIRLAVPLLKYQSIPPSTNRCPRRRKTTNLSLNSSGTSTDGCCPPPAAPFDDLATTSGFSSCAVREGRET
jgi:hypothetical protein